MSFIKGIEIEGCQRRDRSVLVNVDLHEPKNIGLHVNGYEPYCGINGREDVTLKVSNRGIIATTEGLKIADVHIVCPEIRCRFHQDKKSVVNCLTTFPLSVRADGHSVCFARNYVSLSLPSEVDLAPTDGGFRCNQHDCPYHRYHTINLHF